jgi:hypothetical protein
LGASSTYRAIREDIKLFPCKIQKQRALHGSNKTRRDDLTGDLKTFLEENPAVPRSISFSDEGHFHLNGYMNKQNVGVWAREHLHNIVERALHPEKCTVWCALSVSSSANSFYSTVLITISMSFKKNFFHFSKEWVSVLGKHIFNKTHCRCSFECAQ